MNLVSKDVVPSPTTVRTEPFVPTPTEYFGSKNVV